MKKKMKLVLATDITNKESTQAYSTGDWSELPEELLNLIKEKLLLPDLIRFSCVCTSWRSVSAKAIRHKSRQPWLIVPYTIDQGNPGKQDNVCRDGQLGLYSILDGTTYKIETPQVIGHRICSAAFGWLVTVHENLEMQLFHPFTKKVFSLPPFTKFPHVVSIRRDEEKGMIYTLCSSFQSYTTYSDNMCGPHLRAITCRDPDDRCSSHPPLVIAIHSLMPYLYFCRPGKDDSWNKIQGNSYWYCDLTFYKGNLYALRYCGDVDIVKGLDGLSPPTRSLVALGREEGCDNMGILNYLIASANDLFVVIMTTVYDFDGGFIKKLFTVFMRDFKENKWVKVKDIGNLALFVGFGNSFSIDASEFPGCKGNCIYFSHADQRSCRGASWHYCDDIGIFNLKDGTTEAICPIDSKFVCCPRPLWFSANSS